jgi:hypothetical protein
MLRVIDEEILDILDMTFAPKELSRSIAAQNPAVAPLFLGYEWDKRELHVGGVLTFFPSITPSTFHAIAGFWCHTERFAIYVARRAPPVALTGPAPCIAHDGVK